MKWIEGQGGAERKDYRIIVYTFFWKWWILKECINVIILLNFMNEVSSRNRFIKIILHNSSKNFHKNQNTLNLKEILHKTFYDALWSLIVWILCSDRLSCLQINFKHSQTLEILYSWFHAHARKFSKKHLVVFSMGFSQNYCNM